MASPFMPPFMPPIPPGPDLLVASPPKASRDMLNYLYFLLFLLPICCICALVGFGSIGTRYINENRLSRRFHEAKVWMSVKRRSLRSFDSTIRGGCERELLEGVLPPVSEDVRYWHPLPPTSVWQVGVTFRASIHTFNCVHRGIERIMTLTSSLLTLPPVVVASKLSAGHTEAHRPQVAAISRAVRFPRVSESSIDQSRFCGAHVVMSEFPPLSTRWQEVLDAP